MYPIIGPLVRNWERITIRELVDQEVLDEKGNKSLDGEGAFDFSDNDIALTIPFNFINEVGDKVGDKTLNDSQTRALVEIWNNPNVTKPQLMIACNLGKTSVDNIISVLKKKGYIERVGSNKSGYWKAKD